MVFVGAFLQIVLQWVHSCLRALIGIALFDLEFSSILKFLIKSASK